MSLRHQRLSAASAAHVYAENARQPMNAGLLAILDEKPRLSQLRAALEARMSHIGVTRRRLHFAPLNLGHPTWESDPSFDITHHVDEVVLDTLDAETLRAATGRLLSETLDRGRPLWSAHLIRGKRGSGAAVLLRVHQALLETLGTGQLTEAIFDLSPKADDPETWDVPHAPQQHENRSLTQIADALRDNAVHRLDVANQIQRAALGENRALTSSSMRLSTRLLWEANTRGKRPHGSLPLNRPGSGHRQLHWTSLSFATARAIRRATGGAVNDVVLTALAESMSRYCSRHDIATAGRSIRIAIPVRVRRSSSQDANANRTSYLPLHLPLDIGDPVRRLRAIHGSTHLLRDARVPETLHLAGSVMSLTPPALQAAATSLWSRSPNWGLLHTVMGSLSCPHISVYLARQPVRAIVPVTSLAPGQGIGFTVANYDGSLWIGATSDAESCPDADLFVSDLESAMNDLAAAAGVEADELDDQASKAQSRSRRTRRRKTA